MAPKPNPDSKSLTPDQVKLLLEVHKQISMDLTIQQWNELALVVSAKNGKSAERFRYLIKYLQSPESSKQGQGTTANSTSKKRKAEADAVLTPSKRIRGTKTSTRRIDEGYVSVEAAAIHEEREEAMVEEAVTASAPEHAPFGQYSAMLLTPQEREDLEKDMSFDALDGLFGLDNAL